MKPWVGLEVGGAGVDRGDGGVLGEPCWDPHALLEDLELRLGRPQPSVSDSERDDALLAALDGLVGRGKAWFFEASLAVDRAATVGVLAGLRDALLLAGWSGELVPSGGARLAALTAIEAALAAAPPPFALGTGDRLRAVAHALDHARSAPYRALRLLDDRALWPALWQRVFARLEALGAPVEVQPLFADPSFTDPRGGTPWPGRPHPTNDLVRAQAALSGAPSPTEWQGDGSLVWLRARTGWELAEALAALLRADADRDVLVVRKGDVAALDAAFALQRLPTLGSASTTTLRPPLAVLSLALAVAFAPRDPQAALELLTLPSGPFQGRVARSLARALGRFPAIGSPEWETAKTSLAEPHEGDEAEALDLRKASLARVASWLEGPPLDRNGAAKGDVLAVASRVTAWAQARAHASDGEHWRGLRAAGAELERLLERDPRDRLRPHEVELLVGRALGGMTARATVEQAGRFAHVASPHGIGTSHDTVVVWHAGWDPSTSPRRSPLRARERAALANAGFPVVADDPRMDHEARAWQRALLAAKKTLIIATPETSLGAAQLALPLWDAIVARTGHSRSPAAIARVTRTVEDVLGTPAARALEPLELPASRERWNVPARTIAPLLADKTRWSPSSLEKLLGCPLRYVLEKLVNLDSGELASLPGDALLYGNLGDRLAEELHALGALGSVARTQDAIAGALDSLLRRHAATLLLPTRADELAQLRQQLTEAMVALSAHLEESGLRVKTVQAETSAPWGEHTISGRTDLILEKADGTPAIIDLKWGASGYRKGLAEGFALQLAVYSESLRVERKLKKAPHAAYFSLSRAEAYQLQGGPVVGATDLTGPPLAATWERASLTAKTLLAELARGRIPVPPADSGTPLLDLLELKKNERPHHYDRPPDGACTYCDYQAICGKKWEQE